MEMVPRDRQQTAQQHEESAISRISHRMLKLSGASALINKKEDSLSNEERERRRREKLKKDAWCRKERKFRDTTDREWQEGDKVVTEHFDGSVEVRELTPEEKRARAARHLAALKALGSPIGSIEEELSKLRLGHKQSKPDLKHDPIKEEDESPVASTSQAPAPSSSSGVALERTERIEPVSDDEEEPVIRIPNTNAEVRSGSTERPSGPTRGASAMQTVRSMFARSSSHAARGGVDNSPVRDRDQRGWTTGEDVDEDSRAEEEAAAAATAAATEPDSSNVQNQSIRFAAVDRPNREGVAGTGRTAPTLGSSGLSMRRTGTGDSRRSFK